MSERLLWERDGLDWPNRAASRFVQAAGLRWHVQQMGSGPVLLLVHGTGAATHSWRSLAPILAQRFTVIAPDLPGHGFTEAPPPERLSLPNMATSLQALLRVLGVNPMLAVGHSAGAAILARMSLDGALTVTGLVSLNGALLPLGGMLGQFFSPMAKLLASFSAVPRLFAWRAADPSVVERMLMSTGSKLEPAGVELYARLIRNSGHAAAALGMMANWDLSPLECDLPKLKPPLLLVVGSNDATVSPAEAQRVRALLPGAEVVSLPGLGHLAHEEQPARAAELIIDFAGRLGALPAPVRGHDKLPQ